MRALALALLVAASPNTSPQPQPLPDASPSTRGAVNTDPTQQLRGKRFVDRLYVQTQDGGVAVLSDCVPSVSSLGACGAGNALQCVLDAGWYACQPDGGWALLGSGAGGGALATVGAVAPLVSDGGTISCVYASAADSGCIAANDYIAWYAKQAALTFTAPLANTANTVTCATASASQDGCLARADFSTLSSKVAAVTGTAPITSSGGTSPAIGCTTATDSVTGCMSAVDHASLTGKLSAVTAVAPLLSTGSQLSVDPLGYLPIGTVDAGFGFFRVLDAGQIFALWIAAGSVDAGTMNSAYQSTGALDAGQIGAGSVQTGVAIDGTLDAGATILASLYTPAALVVYEVCGGLDAGAIYSSSMQSPVALIGSLDAGVIGAASVQSGVAILGSLDGGPTILASLYTPQELALYEVVGGLDASTIYSGSVQTLNALLGNVDAGTLGAASVQTPKLVVGSVDAGQVFATSLQTPVALLGSVDAGQVGAAVVQTPSALVGGLDAGTVYAGFMQSPTEYLGYLDAGFAWLQGGAWLGSKPLNMLLNTDPEGTIDYITDDAGTVPGLGRHLVVQAPTDGGFYGDAGTRRILPYADEVTVWTPAYRDAGIPSSVYGKFVQGSFDGGVSVVDLSAYPFTSVMTCSCDVEDGGAAGTPSSCQWSRTNSTGIKLTFFGAGALGWSATCLGTGYSYDAGSAPDAGLFLFELAPANGAGMGTACAGTIPTGGKGETVGFTRSSSMTCLKGGANTNIANGDLVTLTTNQPSVSPRPDGTATLGFWYEEPHTNIALQSEAFDNAAWTKASGTVAAPTVTANAAVAPDGNTTAERVQFAASASGQYSVVDQSVGTGSYTGSVFVKGNGTSGTLDLDCNNGSDHCQACAYVSGSWSRCSCSATGGSPLLIIGNYTAGCTTVRSANDVFLWGGDIDQATSGNSSALLSYISTTTAAASHSDDVWTVSQTVLSADGVTNTNGCVGGDVWTPNSGGNIMGCGLMGGDSSGSRMPYVLSTGNEIRAYDGTNQSSSTGVSSGLLYNQLLSVAARWQTGVGINGWSTSIGDGTLNSSYAAGGALGASMIEIGHTNTGCASNPSMWITNFRMDTYAKDCH